MLGTKEKKAPSLSFPPSLLPLMELVNEGIQTVGATRNQRAVKECKVGKGKCGGVGECFSISVSVFVSISISISFSCFLLLFCSFLSDCTGLFFNYC